MGGAGGGEKRLTRCEGSGGGTLTCAMRAARQHWLLGGGAGGGGGHMQWGDPHLRHEGGQAALAEHRRLAAHVGAAEHDERGAARIRTAARRTARTAASEGDVVGNKGAASTRHACLPSVREGKEWGVWGLIEVGNNAHIGNGQTSGYFLPARSTLPTPSSPPTHTLPPHT